MGEVNNGIIIIILNTLTPSNLGQLGIWDGERRASGRDVGGVGEERGVRGVGSWHRKRGTKK